ncbi:MAG TPA: tetratricopeptide repeat protein [Leptolyngbyaceae cyanobacterium]
MLQVAIFVCVGWLASVCLHEFGHAIVAYWGGDTSVKEKGYLTLNPLKYTDFNLSLVLPLIFLLLGGIPLPGAAVYINHHRLRNRFWKSAVSAAGPLFSILVMLILAIIFKLGFPSSLDAINTISLGGNGEALSINDYTWIWPALAFLIYLEAFVVIINLLPIPSLDGFGIIEPWLPPEMQNQARKFSKFGIILLFGLLWFVEPLGSALARGAFYITHLLGISSLMISLGAQLFNKWAAFLLVAAIIIAFVVRKITQKPHEAWYEKGNGKLKARKYEEAIVDFDQSIRFKSDFEQAWYKRGSALLQLQKDEEALTAYDKAVEIKPDFWEVWYERAFALKALQRHEDAIESFNKALEFQPEFYVLWYEKGKLLAHLELHKEAIAAYDKAIEIYAYDATIWTDRGVALGYLKRYEEAIASCEKAIKINPKNFLAWYNKGGCYAEQGNVEMAIETLQQAAKIDRERFKNHAKNDTSFDLIKNHPAFKKLIDE